MRVVPIIRSRTGCFTCRRRKKKCNEEKPVCSGCRRNKLDCRWPAQQLAPHQHYSSNKDASSPMTPQYPSPSAYRLHHGQEYHDAPSQRLATGGPKAGQRISASEMVGGIMAIDGTANSATSSTLCLQPLQPLLSPPSACCSCSPCLQQDEAGRWATRNPRFHQADFQQRHADETRDDASQAPWSSSRSPTSSLFSDDASPQLQPVYSASSVHMTSSESSSLVQVGSTPDMTTFTDSTAVVRAASVGKHAHQHTHHQQPGETTGGSFMNTITSSSPLSLAPSHSSHDSYELLSHYLSRTADSMGNGSTSVNPFVAKLIPLAFSNPLVLQLLLAQSAAHRQASKGTPETGCQIAQRYYTDSLRMFRNVVGDHVSGKDENTLTLTVGSLILCLTEVARGDIHGTIFDHLAASTSLLTMMLSSRPKLALLQDLPEFLVEYYMHIAASSIISMDMATSNAHTLLNPSIESMARALVSKQYMGQLCGCWLELLILIPLVFRLGRGMLSRAAQRKPPLADDMMTYGLLQSQILAFFPSSAASPYSQLAGLVFKQATLLYLWSILGTPQQGSCINNAHRDLMQGAVSEVVALLAQFPASARVNTSLCWPLAVVGCCTADCHVQGILGQRLRVMIEAIGLGNMRQTLVLLERVWSQSPDKTSPWTLRETMLQHQIWISFA